MDTPTIDTAADELLATSGRVVADQPGVAVNFAKRSGGSFGVSSRGSVDVDNSHATGQQGKTLAHELAHEALHKAGHLRVGYVKLVMQDTAAA